MSEYKRGGLTFDVPNGAVRLERTIFVDGQEIPYHFAWQLADGPCVVLAFINLYSLVHHEIPNIQFSLTENGINRENLIRLFSHLYDRPIQEEDIIELPHQKSAGKEKKVATSLIEILDNNPEGSMVCATCYHCTAIQKYKDSYAIIDANNQQGLEVRNRNGIIDYIQNRLGIGAQDNSEYTDFFCYPHK